MLSSEYIAGFIDGEGCIMIRRNNKSWSVDSELTSLSQEITSLKR